MKRHTIIAAFMIAALQASGQSMKELFLSLPDSTLLPTMTKVNKEDCVDFLESNMKARVKTKFDSQAELEILTPDYLKLRLSSMSLIEARLLPTADSTKTICWVETFGNDSTLSESNVSFFTTSWEKLNPKDYLPSTNNSMINRPDTMSALTWDEIRNKIGTEFHTINLSASEATLTVSFSMGGINASNRDKVAKFISKPVRYMWRDGKFVVE